MTFECVCNIVCCVCSIIGRNRNNDRQDMRFKKRRKTGVDFKARVPLWANGIRPSLQKNYLKNQKKKKKVKRSGNERRKYLGGVESNSSSSSSDVMVDVGTGVDFGYSKRVGEFIFFFCVFLSVCFVQTQIRLLKLLREVFKIIKTIARKLTRRKFRTITMYNA